MGSELAKRRLSREEIAFAARRASEGAPQTTIAGELGVTQGSVSKALTRHHQRQAASLDLGVEKMRLVGSFAGIREAALEGYRASLRPAEKMQERIRSGPPDGLGQSTQTGETSVTRSAPNANARLLAVAMDANREIGRILGLTPEEERLRAAEKKRSDAEEAWRKNGPFAFDPAAAQSSETNTAVPDREESGLTDAEREREVADAMNFGKLELSPTSWELILSNLSRESWDRLLPKMPLVFQQEMRAAAIRQIQSDIAAERHRRGLPPLSEPGTSSV